MDRPLPLSPADLALLLPAAPEHPAAPEQTVLALFDLHRTPLLRYALSFGLSLHDAEDVLQETFLALFHHLRQDRSRSNLHGWLFRVTHNLALKRRARNSRNPSHHEPSAAEALPDSALTPEADLLLREQQLWLLSIFRALPERDRQCLQLRAEGLTYREIARATGISLGSVSTRIARSLARLAQATAPERSR